MNLVIVESPSKTKTIKQYLGKEYDVVATKGHIRDIKNCGEGNLGLDQNNDYKPIYEVIPRQYQTIRMLNDAVSKADNIYLATDPDREGEAISWHLNEVLKLGGKDVKRIEFNEITEPAIKNAINNPRDIDDRLFHSQETRKIMDRVIGYRLSGLVKKSVGPIFGTQVTAGRVQSACLKMITDREKEIKSFVPKTFYDIEVDFGYFKAKLIDEKKKNKTFDDFIDAKNVIDSLGEYFVVSSIDIKEEYRRPGAPYTTSSLMQAALNKYNLSSKKTMKIAQELYEGVDVDGKHIALITYMRTDSTRFSDQFKGQLHNFIKDNFGEEYCGYLHQKELAEGAQDAHEAIRPVSLRNTKEKVKDFLTKEQFQIYSLIYDEALESMMKDSKIEAKIVTLVNNGYEFQASFEKTIFDGFKINKQVDEKIKEFKGDLGDAIKPVKDPILNTKETEGPRRYTEATIIKEMESSGIGRPSTYASTIDTLKVRKYISIVNKKEIEPTEEGMLVSKFLEDNFKDIINVKYTAEMEKELDEIATGIKQEEEIVPEFYNTFSEAYNNVKNNITPLTTGDICPICGSEMVYRSNSYGSFEACSNYPNCKYIKKQEPKKEEIEIECPECHVGHLVQRTAKKGTKVGKKFYACSRFPECRFTISTIKGLDKK